LGLLLALRIEVAHTSDSSDLSILLDGLDDLAGRMLVQDFLQLRASGVAWIRRPSCLDVENLDLAHT
jgi:hypothetical protein